MGNKLTIFIDRMNKLGINVKLIGNYPWIYIVQINGKHVVEKFQSNHGFTIAFSPIRKNDELTFSDIGEIFRVIRTYC